MLTELSDSEAEVAVLAGLMLAPDLLERVALAAEDFASPRHRELYAVLVGLIAERQPVDPIAVGAALEQRGALERIGGRAVVWEISLAIPSASAVPHYAGIVRELSALRQLRAAAALALQRVAERVPSVEVGVELVRGVECVASRASVPAWVPLRECVREALDQIERAHQGEIRPGVSSGLKTLDGKVGGFQPGHMIVMAGRPSMGKTALALGTGLAAALQGKVVGLFSLEMSRVEIAKRLLAMAGTDLSVSGLDYGYVAPAGWTQLAEGAGLLSELPFFVADKAYMTIDELRRLAFGLQRQSGLDVLILDYLQLLETEGRAEYRVASWTAISRKLKVLAKELAIPIVVLSQLSRECERRVDKRPMLSDLRESGAIEQDADMVIFVYRDEVYDEDSTDRGVAELLIRKNRHGPIGEARVAFDGRSTKFSDGIGVHV